MTASPRTWPVQLSPGTCAELAAIKPVTLADALAEYATDVAALTDEQLAHEVARVEALPGGAYRQILAEEQGRRDERALVASMASPLRWGWTA